MASSVNFNDKVVLVTGSSSGIGEGIAIYLASLGAKVVVTGRREDRLKQVVEKCRSPNNHKALYVVADVTKDEDARRLISSAVNHFGKLDVLVNNAGMGKVYKGTTDPNVMDAYDAVLNLNLRSVFYLTHLAIAHLEKTKGNIINISSVAGLAPFPPFGIYCISKAGLDMFTKNIALEFAPKGIRVNSINPGPVHSEFLQAMGIPGGDQILEQARNDVPLGIIGVPEDIAKAVAYLASEDARFITGATIIADGGAIGKRSSVAQRILDNADK